MPYTPRVSAPALSAVLAAGANGGAVAQTNLGNLTLAAGKLLDLSASGTRLQPELTGSPGQGGATSLLPSSYIGSAQTDILCDPIHWMPIMDGANTYYIPCYA